jgi:HTH-type transcriptional regulator/antitoxin HigA
MTKFSLGQEWVSKVTRSDHPDVPVMGANRSPLPDARERSAFLDEMSRSETVREMSRRKWFKPSLASAKERVAERGAALFEFLAVNRATRPAYAMFKGRRLTAKRSVLDNLGTQAWIAHITDVAQECSNRTTFAASSISRELLRSIAQLSTSDRGPRQALDVLREVGICVVLESGLPGMSVDGASFHTTGANPVLALTARHDRLDNFWFTLFHEIGHICLHLSEPSDDVFVDSEEESGSDGVEAEAEANAFAKDNLIPRDTWLRSDAHRFGTEASVVALAKHLGIHPAIVAGRIRFERHEFRIFDDLIGRGQVRDVLFAD